MNEYFIIAMLFYCIFLSFYLDYKFYKLNNTFESKMLDLELRIERQRSNLLDNLTDCIKQKLNDKEKHLKRLQELKKLYNL